MDYREYDVPCGTIEKYIKLLKQWNKKINLISANDLQELKERHVMDSLQLLKYINKDQVLYDIGSGAGFPGLMLSYAGVKEVHLVERITKKANFLTLAAAFSKDQLRIHNLSAEDIRCDKCDVITARGLSSLENIFEATQNIVKENTRYILLKGRNTEEEIKKALENWQFKYIIHQSVTSPDGYVLEAERLEKK
ncbi:MAG: 16S rRNA (guanine(527)-N(7))-methyltransferase RsmG [Pseudomonadota bacterium]